MIIALAVLGFIGLVFGMRALRAVVLTGGAVVTLYMGVVMADIFQFANHTGHYAPKAEVALPTCTAKQMAEEMADKDGWRAVGGHPTFCDDRQAQVRPHAAEPGHGPSRAFIESDPPQPVATVPASPASSWELLPWPPDAPDTQTPSPAAQRLLDRLNGWTK